MPLGSLGLQALGRSFNFIDSYYLYGMIFRSIFSTNLFIFIVVILLVNEEECGKYTGEYRKFTRNETTPNIGPFRGLISADYISHGCFHFLRAFGGFVVSDSSFANLWISVMDARYGARLCQRKHCRPRRN
jgi:hypothetical protein